MKPFAITLFSLLLATASAPALADTVYTYTGNDYTTVNAPFFNTSESISGSFTLSSPLAPDTTTIITPTQFTFTDGPSTFTQANTSSSSFFEIVTDASGNIAGWDISLPATDGSAELATHTLYGNPTDIGGIDGQVSYNGITTDPGTWAISTTDASPTPEPSGLVLFGTAALAGAASLRRRLIS